MGEIKNAPYRGILPVLVYPKPDGSNPEFEGNRSYFANSKKSTVHQELWLTIVVQTLEFKLRKSARSAGNKNRRGVLPGQEFRATPLPE